MKGRKPLATAVKEASGALAHDPQRRNPNEPTANRGYPKMPESVYANEVASRIWNETCDTLNEMSILTTSDLRLLEVFCLTYAEWLRLQAYVQGGNCRISNDKGNESTSPEAGQVHKYADRVLKMLAELGLTPSSRSRLHVTKEEVDPFADFLNARLSKN